ncbi:MAG TPA: hypothetical protein VFG99_13000 [Chloroflexia bacterium]|nr:hypothetical protein [Chloroflexia bacterium]
MRFSIQQQAVSPAANGFFRLCLSGAEGGDARRLTRTQATSRPAEAPQPLGSSLPHLSALRFPPTYPLSTSYACFHNEQPPGDAVRPGRVAIGACSNGVAWIVRVAPVARWAHVEIGVDSV